MKILLHHILPLLPYYIMNINLREDARYYRPDFRIAASHREMSDSPVIQLNFVGG